MEIAICILLALGLIEGGLMLHELHERNELLKVNCVTEKLLKELKELEDQHGDY